MSSVEREIKLFDEEGLAQSCDTVPHKLGQHPTLVRCWAFHCRRTITGLYWGTCRVRAHVELGLVKVCFVVGFVFGFLVLFCFVRLYNE